MPVKFYSRAVILLVLLSPYAVSAQNNKINNTTQLWSEIDLFGQITPKLKWQVDGQYSRQSPYENGNLFQYSEQGTLRSWLHYYPKPTIKLSVFAGLWYNFPIENGLQREYPEYRTALQAQFYKKWGKNTISNRLRTEFRIIKDRQGVFEPVFRGRYMFKYLRLLTHTTYDANSWYGIFSEEVFFNGTSNVTGPKVFDQNRLFLGVGYNITDDIAMETGYFNQFAYHNHDTNFDSNHIWQVSLILDNLTKAKKKHSS